MEPREHWRQVYATRKADEVSWYQVSPDGSLNAFDRVGATPGLALVDIGGGASTLVDSLLERGWQDLTVVDIAEPALAAAQARLGDEAARVRWEVADIRDWCPTRTFDIWHDRAVFHFLTDPADRAAYRRALVDGTHAGSHAILATFALDGPEKCSGLPVQRYDAPALAAELGGPFHLIGDWREGHVTPWGAKQSFQWCVFTRT